MAGAHHWKSLVYLCFVLVLASGCAPPAAAPAQPAKPAGPAPAAQQPAGQTPAREPRTLQVGFIGLAGYWYNYWGALHSGIYRELGLNPERYSVQTNEAIAALTSGGMDILQAPSDAGLTAISKGANMVLVADHINEAPYDLVARPEIASVADLRGKKVGASSLRAGTGTIARVMMRARGFTDDDYELTQTGGNPQRYAALQAGGTEAAIIADPVNFRATLDGYRVLMSFSEVIPEYLFVAWWVRRDWLDNPENREALASFITGLVRGKEWAHAPENRERMIEIWMQETQSPRAVAERMYEYYMIQRPGAVDSSDIRSAPMQAVVKIMQELEDLPPLPPESQWIDRTYVERARQAVGR